ncbi:hypothetical protein BOTBODRAFT_128323 [Botryobasidium botryosum FD-172 SS1]|uniref:Protein kinase domain-containing protein n=1 Tax=Botryobasidium botryosum (strain FD-172 SS1) TaxID=930990 RepID=A0A067N259_BOTB1|nr:hypothetical protein BOTBODRAFT_128323 [Botryobasidium botryosum FD-172 SS1]
MQPLNNVLHAEGVHSIVYRAQREVAGANESTIAAPAIAIPAVVTRDGLSGYVAIKVVSLIGNENKEPHDILTEAKLLAQVAHPNIISLLAFSLSPDGEFYELYMPLMPINFSMIIHHPSFSPYPLPEGCPVSASQIFSLVTDHHSFFETFAKSISFQILLALAHLHDLSIAHRDIKPGNVLLSPTGCVKLIDFGVSWKEGEVRGNQEAWEETPQSMCCQVASGSYRAPELLFGPLEYNARATDLWSLGATLASFYTPLRFTSDFDEDYSMDDPDTSEDGDEDGGDIADGNALTPFIFPATGPGAGAEFGTWTRDTLFNADRGEIGLAWSIFKILGTPNETSWPDFRNLPDAQKLSFTDVPAMPLSPLLPNLPNPEFTPAGASPLDLIQRLLAYPPTSRLSAQEALSHPWFASGDLVLPTGHPGPTYGEKTIASLKWQAQPIGDWVRPLVEGEIRRFEREVEFAEPTGDVW